MTLGTCDVLISPEQGEEVEPGDGEREGPELPLPGHPQSGVRAAVVHVHHHQDGRHVAEHVRQVVNLQIPNPVLGNRVGQIQ